MTIGKIKTDIENSNNVNLSKILPIYKPTHLEELIYAFDAEAIKFHFGVLNYRPEYLSEEIKANEKYFLKFESDIQAFEKLLSLDLEKKIGEALATVESNNRRIEDILEEVKEFYKLGCRYFRLGKQADFYSIEDPIRLLKGIRESCPGIEVLHLDNVNPVFVINEKGIEITKAIVKYCSSGNVAAFGVESFDPVVIKENTLNCTPGIAMKAIKILNELGSERGEDGMPRYLPGINIIYGLGHESKKTHEYNMESLKQIYDNGWMLRRINIRQAAILPGTMMEQKFGKKYYRKNKKHYWGWRDDIRQNIDYPMLQRVVPKGTILKNIYAEIHDGNTTFGRQFGTYPLIVGIKGKLELKKFVSVKITGHMLRSVTGEVV